MAGATRNALAERGEAEVQINGERRLIHFSLNAQARIIEALGLEKIEQIPQLMKNMNAEIFATLIHASLVDDDGGEPMTLDELMNANVPMYSAQVALINAIRLATWGTTEAPDPTEVPTTVPESDSHGILPKP